MMCVRPMKKEALAGWAVGVGSVEHRGEHAVVCEYATFFFLLSRSAPKRRNKERPSAGCQSGFLLHPSIHARASRPSAIGIKRSSLLLLLLLLLLQHESEREREKSTQTAAAAATTASLMQASPPRLSPLLWLIVWMFVCAMWRIEQAGEQSHHPATARSLARSLAPPTHTPTSLPPTLPRGPGPARPAWAV